MSEKVLHRILVVIGVIATVAAAVIVSWHVRAIGVPKSSGRAEWGAFGDFLAGTVGVVAAFLGLVALLVTIALQARALRITADELQLSTTELKRSSGALAAQQETLERQRAESYFFNVLKTFGDVARAVDLRGTLSGRNAVELTWPGSFKTIVEYVMNTYSARQRRHPEEPERQLVQVAYNQWYGTWSSMLDHYYRYLETLMALAGRFDSEKEQYYELINAQLSDQEQVLLAYHCIAGKASAKLAAHVADVGFVRQRAEAHLSPEHVGLLDAACEGALKDS